MERMERINIIPLLPLVAHIRRVPRGLIYAPVIEEYDVHAQW